MANNRRAASQFSLPSLRDDNGCGLTRRCIPVDCIPLCGTCQEHTTPWSLVKRYLKCLFAMLCIAFLASTMAKFFESNPCEPGSVVEDGICVPVNSKEMLDQIDKKLCALNVQTMNVVQDLYKIKEEIYKLKGCSGEGEYALEENQKNAIIELIQEQLSIYDSDKTGLPDFALENLGGCILSVGNTKTYKKGVAKVSILGLSLMSFATDPRAILQASVVPGECWAFEGDKGSVVIQLSSEILVTHVTLEHIPSKLSPSGNVPSAPKDFDLRGLRSVSDTNPHLFGEFTYNNEGPAVQTFQVEHPSTIPFGIVELVIRSNHGNEEFTCIYRVRVHGKLPDPKIQN